MFVGFFVVYQQWLRTDIAKIFLQRQFYLFKNTFIIWCPPLPNPNTSSYGQGFSCSKIHSKWEPGRNMVTAFAKCSPYSSDQSLRNSQTTSRTSSQKCCFYSGFELFRIQKGGQSETLEMPLALHLLELVRVRKWGFFEFLRMLNLQRYRKFWWKAFSTNCKYCLHMMY